MCTGFVRKGKDLIYGFNLDIDPNVWNFRLYKTDSYFTVGIKVGSTVYFTHGVNSKGNFSNLPYMNGLQQNIKSVKPTARVDLLTDRYIRGKYSYSDIEEIVSAKNVVNFKDNSMHSLLCDSEGHIMLIEPGYGIKQITSDYGLIANFPILADLTDFSNPFYGKDRYDKAEEILKHSDDDFNVQDGLALLKQVRQIGQWGTKISFVYSRNENAVYYCLDGNFEKIEKHKFVI